MLAKPIDPKTSPAFGASFAFVLAILASACGSAAGQSGQDTSALRPEVADTAAQAQTSAGSTSVDYGTLRVATNVGSWSLDYDTRAHLGLLATTIDYGTLRVATNVGSWSLDYDTRAHLGLLREGTGSTSLDVETRRRIGQLQGLKD